MERVSNRNSLEDLTLSFQNMVLDETAAPARSASVTKFFENRIALSITEAAVLLGLSAKKVERLCKSGEIKSKSAGRRVLIPVAAIEAWLNS